MGTDESVCVGGSRRKAVTLWPALALFLKLHSIDIRWSNAPRFSMAIFIRKVRECCLALLILVPYLVSGCQLNIWEQTNNKVNTAYIFSQQKKKGFLSAVYNPSCSRVKGRNTVYVFKPGGILQTVAGCQPYRWLQLGLWTKMALSLRHSANTSPPM